MALSKKLSPLLAGIALTLGWCPTAATADIFVGDFGGNAVQEYNQNTGALVRTFSDPDPGQVAGVALDPSGQHLFVSNYSNGNIYEFNANTGALMSPTPYGTMPSLQVPGTPDAAGSLAFGPGGNLYVGDNSFGVNAVAVFNGSSTAPIAVITPFAAPTFTTFAGGLAFGAPNGNLYVGDYGGAYSGAATIGQVTLGSPLSSSTSATALPAGSVAQNNPTAQTFGLTASGLLWHGTTLYVSDSNNNQILEMHADPTTGALSLLPSSIVLSHVPQFSVAGINPGGDPTYNASNSPASLVADSAGTGFYVSAGGPSQAFPSGLILHYAWDGTLLGNLLGTNPDGSYVTTGYVPTGLAISSQSTPEPASWILAAVAAAGLACLRRRPTTLKRLPPA